ncbi:MAG: hypothetical protein KA223_08465 [Candidatus Accumulibacter sp.]|nr:hypothetical protein [Accumulibacter sp.]
MPELLERCPACRARLAESALCPRCGCDFALVRQAEEQARSLLEQAIRTLAGGDPAGARVQIRRSLASRRLHLAQALESFLIGRAAAREERSAATPGLDHAEQQEGGEDEPVQRLAVEPGDRPGAGEEGDRRLGTGAEHGMDANVFLPIEWVDRPTQQHQRDEWS